MHANISGYAIIILCCILLPKPGISAVPEPLLMGTVRNPRGVVVRSADICLYRADYNALTAAGPQTFPQGASRCRKTDRSGTYQLFFPDRGTYLLLARKRNMWAMRRITPSDNLDTLFTSDTLRTAGALRFQVHCEQQTDHRAKVALTGTPYLFSSDTTGAVTISGIPQGTYAALIKSVHQGYHTVQCSLRIRSSQEDFFSGTLKIPKESAAWVPAKPVMVESEKLAAPEKQPVVPKTVQASPPEPQTAAVPPKDTSSVTPKKAVTAAPAPKRTFSTPTGKPPIVKAPADTFIGIFDTLTLSGTATDDGSIIRREWDIGATGKFIPTDDGRILLPPFKAPVSYFKCIFRATDNDGLTATDTTFVHVALLWRSVTPPKELLGRNGHSLVTFNNDLLIVGGNRNDVWSSSDGISWTLITDAAPFGKIFGHTTVFFNNRLWIIGGKTGPKTFSSAIWSSSSGAVWQKAATLPFDKRLYHTAVEFHGRLWIIGGLGTSETDPILNDVWSTSDGVNWKLETKNAPFAARYGHGCTVFSDRMYLLGGFSDAVGSQQSFNDVWESSDGATWTCTNKAAPFSKDRYHCALSFDNKLWMVGGYDTEDGTDRFTDILYTADGSTWINLTAELKGGNRFFCAAVPLGNRILISPSDSHKLWIMR
jgi:hypothetical protein